MMAAGDVQILAKKGAYKPLIVSLTMMLQVNLKNVSNQIMMVLQNAYLIVRELKI